MTGPALEHLPTFAQRLRIAQAEAGLTAEALARQIGVGVRVVQRWRAGDATPSGVNLVALAAALKHDAAWFYAPVDDRRAA